MTSAANERRVAAAKRQLAKDKETDKVVVVALMSSPDGRRWVWLKLSEAQIFVEDESFDPYIMAWRKGIRNNGLRLLASVTTHAPEMYIRMTQENAPVPLRDPNEEEQQQDEDNE